MPVSLFIDTNIFLNFYSYSDDEITELHKVIQLIQDESIKLYLPEQICHEFLRRREEKINETFENFKNDIKQKIPSLMSHYKDDVENYRKAYMQLQCLHKNLLESAKKDVANQSLPADNLFKKISEAAAPILLSEEARKKAEQRTYLGNPPGKKGQPGDRLNWETLLEVVPDSIDLHFITGDKDYYSIIEKENLSPVLQKEWLQSKNSKIFIYKTLAPFFGEHFPQIKIPNDIEKNQAITLLRESNAFTKTHEAIKQLTPLRNFLNSNEQDELFEIGKYNTQISWIRTDPDVQSFYRNLLDDCRNRYTDQDIATIEEFFDLSHTEQED